MKYELVDELRVTYPVSWLLEIAYIKPASYYKWRKNNHKREEKVRDEQEIREHKKTWLEPFSIRIKASSTRQKYTATD
ncbi:hypothetical protein [Cytobacillus kochii]|uniref:hypothetical protein n=1 Tax=Cytobacillus kochii TaxID=859143 RepID=UPI00390813B0